MYAVDWSFEGANGAVTVRQEGGTAICQALAPSGGALRKAWLLGTSGRALLGTLIPEGGGLRLRRRIPVEQLRRQGAWPPTGAEIGAVRPPGGGENAPPGWHGVDCPGQLMGDPLLAQALQGVEKALLKRDEEGFLLAFPYGGERPFPIPPLFCLSWLERLGGRWYVLFRFSRRGCPELAHNFQNLGEATSEI